MSTTLPCPFCGSTDLVDGSWYVDDDEVPAVECNTCKSGAPLSAWNSRPNDQLVYDVAQEEGFEQFPYRCPAGKLTIGHGFNLDDVGLYEDESLAVLRLRIVRHVADLEGFKWWPFLEDRQKRAMVNMHYVLGSGGFRTFKKMLGFLDKEDVYSAADEVLDSKFGRTHTNRAARIAAGLRG